MKHPFVLSIALVLLIGVEIIVAIYSDPGSLFDSGIKKEVYSLRFAGENVIEVNNLQPDQEISSPLKITGKAKGSWFFEGDFPVVLVNWDGLIIGEGFVKAKGEWMTPDFVPFEADIIFEEPVDVKVDTYNEKGTIIFKKSNPSGLPQYDAAVEIPIKFKAK